MHKCKIVYLFESEALKMCRLGESGLLQYTSSLSLPSPGLFHQLQSELLESTIKVIIDKKRSFQLRIVTTKKQGNILIL